ncbi:MAG: hypothetical protein A2284_07460 [Deltaproteobacteria bacterium RIFOXYA12_FULL_61_11]|nr:MAG: hypothetical protein A2284_07460 [Deltaproteobacteria bacterium RIFOXYA12_FULL_61_11]
MHQLCDKNRGARVELFRLEHGEPLLAALASIENGIVAITGDPDAVAMLNAGITDPLTNRPMTTDDGFAFLSALSSVYKNPYLYATDVIFDDEAAA